MSFETGSKCVQCVKLNGLSLSVYAKFTATALNKYEKWSCSTENHKEKGGGGNNAVLFSNTLLHGLFSAGFFPVGKSPAPVFCFA